MTPNEIRELQDDLMTILEAHSHDGNEIHVFQECFCFLSNCLRKYNSDLDFPTKSLEAFLKKNDGGSNVLHV